MVDGALLWPPTVTVQRWDVPTPGGDGHVNVVWLTLVRKHSTAVRTKPSLSAMYKAHERQRVYGVYHSAVLAVCDGVHVSTSCSRCCAIETLQLFHCNRVGAVAGYTATTGANQVHT